MARFRGFTLAILFFICFAARSHQVSNKLEQQALYAFSTYCPATEVHNWTCYWCQNNELLKDKLTVVDTFYNKQDDSFALVGYTSKYIQIAIRGTIATSITAWIRDLSFGRDPYNGMEDLKVHIGFYRVYKGMASNLFAAFSKSRALCPKCSSVRVTGHSLGGAVATIAAVEIQNITKLPVQLFTFGSPRVGNDAFANYVVKQLDDSVRVVHESDIVARVPPKTFGFYHHVSTEIWQHKGEYIECDGTGEDPHCSDSVKVPNLMDHVTYMDYKLWSGWPDCAGVFGVNPPSALELQQMESELAKLSFQ